MHRSDRFSQMPTPQIPICYRKQGYLSVEISKRALLNDTLLIGVSADTPVDIRECVALHMSQELLVMGDDDQLEVLLMLSGLDDSVQ